MLSVLFYSSFAFAAPTLDPLVVEAEAEWIAGRFDASNARLDQRLAVAPDDAEALWRRARNIYSEGEMLAEQGVPVAERLAMYAEMEALMARGLAKHPGHGGLLHWYGTATTPESADISESRSISAACSSGGSTPTPSHQPVSRTATAGDGPHPTGSPRIRRRTSTV